MSARPEGLLLRIVRFWLPVVLTTIGLIGVIVGFAVSDETLQESAAYMVGAGLSTWLLNYLYRVSVSGERERDAEDAARRYFDEHGRWPDDPSAR